MAAPIDLRNDFDSVSLRRLAKRTRDATQSRRLLALAEVYDGGSRTDASRIGGVGLQIIRDWVLRFNARGPDGLVDGKSPGAPSKLNADHRRALAEVVEAGPVPAVDGVVRWRRKDLARWLLETFAISLDETTVGRELKALGFAKISARPRHYAQNELAVEAFKKNFPAELAKIRARLPKGVEIELWWQDEARIGQKNKLTRRWARRGTRPRAPRDQRTEWAYIFGAICPAKGKGAGLVMPWCDTDAMAAHLIEISAAVDPGAHAVLIVDQAGWHLTPKAGDPRQHHRPGAAATIARVEPGGECLAIHARQLVVEPDLQILRRHRRAVLPSLEQPHRPTMEDHVPRHAQMGAWVLINDRWYYRKYAGKGGDAAPSFGTPSKKVEIYSETLMRHGYDALPDFVEPAMGVADKAVLAENFPLILTSAKSPQYLGSQGRAIPALRRIEPEPRVELHPSTAAARRIQDGDWVALLTPHGGVRVKAKFSPNLHANVVVATHGWWQENRALSLPGYAVTSAEGANLNAVFANQTIEPMGGAVPHKSYACQILPLDQAAEPTAKAKPEAKVNDENRSQIITLIPATNIGSIPGVMAMQMR